MKRPVVKLITIAAFLLLGACASTSDTPTTIDAVQSPVSDKDYVNLIEKYTKGKKLYDGFNLAFEYHATLMTTDVQDAQIWQQASDLQWTRDKVQLEREKVQANTAKETTVFLSFFTPDNETDNLEATGSIWKIYLVSGGMKYEGKAVRTGGILADLVRRYPHHTRFNTPYLVTFKAPMNLVQQNDTQFILTGTIGTTEVSFPSTAP